MLIHIWSCSNFFSCFDTGSLVNILVSQWWVTLGFASKFTLFSSVQGHRSLCAFPAHLKGITYLFIHIILPVSPKKQPLLKDLQTTELHSFVAPYCWLSIASQSLSFICCPDFISPSLLLWFSCSKMPFPITSFEAVHLKNKNCSRSFLKNGRNKYGRGKILMSPLSSLLCFWLFIWFKV